MAEKTKTIDDVVEAFRKERRSEEKKATLKHVGHAHESHRIYNEAIGRLYKGGKTPTYNQAVEAMVSALVEYHKKTNDVETVDPLALQEIRKNAEIYLFTDLRGNRLSDEEVERKLKSGDIAEDIHAALQSEKGRYVAAVVDNLVPKHFGDVSDKDREAGVKYLARKRGADLKDSTVVAYAQPARFKQHVKDHAK